MPLASDRRTSVCISVDAEFSIGDAFAYPDRHKPIGGRHVWCPVDGRSQGLGFLLGTLEEFGIRATFFVETLQVAYFGDGPMQEIASTVAAAGHDVQLHLHPAWAAFDRSDWRSNLATSQPKDEMHRRETDELAGWMQRGIDTFRRWGLPAPTALRTGNMMIDRNVYRAMSELGLRASSSIAASLFKPSESALQLNHGMHSIEGILEFPVFSYRGVSWGPWSRRKSWTVMGTSAMEARFLLEQARAEKVETVVLLTHCHEFVSGSMRGPLSCNRLNQARFRDLCSFLSSTRDRFETVCIGDSASTNGAEAATNASVISVPNGIAARAILQNGLRDYGFI